MNLYDVLQRYGTVLFLRFVLVALAFLALHLVRMPLVMLVLVVEAGLRLLDRWACRARFASGVAR